MPGTSENPPTSLRKSADELPSIGLQLHTRDLRTGPWPLCTAPPVCPAACGTHGPFPATVSLVRRGQPAEERGGEEASLLSSPSPSLILTPCLSAAALTLKPTPPSCGCSLARGLGHPQPTSLSHQVSLVSFQDIPRPPASALLAAVIPRCKHPLLPGCWGRVVCLPRAHPEFHV